MNARRKLQIGVCGAGHDLQHAEGLHQLAYEVGKCVAEAGHVLVFGANKDEETLPTDAAHGAKDAGGLVIGVTYDHGLDVLKREYADAVIATGSLAGGGRELVLVNSCDAIIVMCGGAGTLNEITIAYELKIPIIALLGSGGWSERLADQYLDERKRVKILPAPTPVEAVRMAIDACSRNTKPSWKTGVALH
jgi:uncharacterized protein (TIGR00725 family)